MIITGAAMTAFTGCGDNSDGQATPTSAAEAPASTAAAAETTAAEAVAAEPLLFAGGDGTREAGAYVIDKFGVPIRVTLPAGWSTFGDFAVVSPAGPAAGYLAFWAVDDVNLDACHWNGRADIGPSADALVAGLVSQGGMEATEPTAIEIDGHAGQELVFSVPADLDVSMCEQGTISPWFEGDGDSRFYAAPGEREVVRVIDLNGGRALINHNVPDDISPEVSQQIQSMVTSIEIG